MRFSHHSCCCWSIKTSVVTANSFQSHQLEHQRYDDHWIRCNGHRASFWRWRYMEWYSLTSVLVMRCVWSSVFTIMLLKEHQQVLWYHLKHDAALSCCWDLQRMKLREGTSDVDLFHASAHRTAHRWCRVIPMQHHWYFQDLPDRGSWYLAVNHAENSFSSFWSQLKAQSQEWCKYICEIWYDWLLEYYQRQSWQFELTSIALKRIYRFLSQFSRSMMFGSSQSSCAASTTQRDYWAALANTIAV